MAPLATAATVGAASALLAAWALGTFGDRVVERDVVERVAAPAAAVLNIGDEPRATIAVLDQLAPALVSVRAGESEGTGIVLRNDGHVLTTAALVQDVDTVIIVTSHGPSLDGEVVGTDPATDIAVLRVPGLREPGAVLGVPSDLDVGDDAMAVALLRSGSAEVARGIIGGLAVTVSRDGESPLHGLISTDIVLPGQLEGAALVDRRGAVVGVTTAAGGSAGIRAVPIDLARVVADDIIETGGPDHPWLGVEGEDLSAEVAAAWGVVGGAHLVEVTEDGPAAAAGLEGDDVVTEVGASPVASMGDLITALRLLGPGDEVRLGYLRGGEHHWCTAVLAETG